MLRIRTEERAGSQDRRKRATGKADRESRTDTRARNPDKWRAGTGAGPSERGRDRKALDLSSFPCLPANRWKPIQGWRPVSHNPPERSREDTGASLPGILESVRRPVFVLQVERVPAIAGRTRAGSKKGHFMGVSQILAYIIYHASMCGACKTIIGQYNFYTFAGKQGGPYIRAGLPADNWKP